MEYAFLSDFDLLRDAHQDIRRKPWATRAARLAIDQAFKLEHAGEELAWLNIEIRRLATYIRDEDACLRAKKLSCHTPTQPSLIKLQFIGWNVHVSTPII